MSNSFIFQDNLWKWCFTYYPYFLRTLEAYTTMVLACHTTPILQIGAFGVYARQRFSYPNPSQHSSQPSSPTMLTLHLKFPISSSRTTISAFLIRCPSIWDMIPLYYLASTHFVYDFLHYFEILLTYYTLSTTYLIIILLGCVIFLPF